MKTLRLGMLDWAWLTPLALGEIDSHTLTSIGIQLEVVRLQSLPDMTDGQFDMVESSLSRHVMRTLSGDTTRKGILHFPMQAFRSRCILVKNDSEAQHAGDLVNGRIGLTGWRNSGNIWTRDALRHDGLHTDGVQWFVGPLTLDALPYDRTGAGGRADVHNVPKGDALVDLLRDTQLDALITPFIPKEAYGPDAEMRPLYTSSAEPELRYYSDRGYVPGIHILTAASWLPVATAYAVAEVLIASRAEWFQRRSRMLDEPAFGADAGYQLQSRCLRQGGDVPSLANCSPMLDDFLRLQVQDGIIATAPPAKDLFVHYEP